VNHQGPRAHRLLNSGLVILEPSEAEFKRIKAFLDTSPIVRNFIFPDQDLLAAVFEERWRPLPFIYNALKTLRYLAVFSEIRRMAALMK
jgi:lipopolysaccharide biosynthesis glycosyltransferase